MHGTFSPLCSAGDYVIRFLQYWIFALGVPAAAVLTLAHAATNHFVLGIIVSYALCYSRNLVSTVKCDVGDLSQFIICVAIILFCILIIM